MGSTTSGTRSPRAAVRAALAVAVGAALLAGCASQPGAAAVVDGRSITQAELNRTATELAPLITGTDIRVVLSALISAPSFIDAAAEHGVGVSVAETRALMDEAAVRTGATEVTDWGDGSVALVRFTLASQSLQGLPDAATVVAEVNEQVRGLDVQVNPRYGALDRTTGAITPVALPWITAPTE
ncbi:SurA N-terminal domain-containing protein [Actinotalea sp. K2]|uniref:SurA N-terminal domain-containing protein n=1 Tax=Actinotalea sp. K2 TaxID=2939438 RepID=UPI002017E3E4|nr:SurA N-terminal domain-containing protein [Actinotalea sp. K2]MCL3861302.1 SurA N-terminal domain-containing protein [Actinotalea sp. K2]